MSLLCSDFCNRSQGLTSCSDLRGPLGRPLLLEPSGHPASLLFQGTLRCAAPLGLFVACSFWSVRPLDSFTLHALASFKPLLRGYLSIPSHNHPLLPRLAQVLPDPCLPLLFCLPAFLSFPSLPSPSSLPPSLPCFRPPSFFLSSHSTFHFRTNQASESLILFALYCSLSISLRTPLPPLINSTWAAIFACFVC